jgi:hypothetical protein
VSKGTRSAEAQTRRNARQANQYALTVMGKGSATQQDHSAYLAAVEALINGGK